MREARVEMDGREEMVDALPDTLLRLPPEPHETPAAFFAIGREEKRRTPAMPRRTKRFFTEWPDVDFSAARHCCRLATRREVRPTPPRQRGARRNAAQHAGAAAPPPSSARGMQMKMRAVIYFLPAAALLVGEAMMPPPVFCAARRCQQRSFPPAFVAFFAARVCASAEGALQQLPRLPRRSRFVLRPPPRHEKTGLHRRWQRYQPEIG